MAVSSSIDYTISFKRIAASALRIIGVLEHGKEPSRAHMESAKEALNLMVKELDAVGIKPWKLTSATFTTVVAQSEYTSADSGFPTDLWKLKEAYYSDTNTTDVYLDIVDSTHYEFQPILAFSFGRSPITQDRAF